MRDFTLNPKLDRHLAYTPDLQAILSMKRAREARTHIGTWAGYAPTPIHSPAAPPYTSHTSPEPLSSTTHAYAWP